MANKRRQVEDGDPHLRMFAKTLEKTLERYTEEEERDVTERQKEQVERLVGLEEEFRQALTTHNSGLAVYRDFITYITEEKRNILSARPFFRERQEVFMERVSNALKFGDAAALFPFAPNFQFIQFVLKSRDWRPGSKIAKIGRQISEARQELVEMNMPLAISRARIFWGKTRGESHLTYMDLIQICAEGLMAGIDKFCLPYSPVFRSVAIGRMVGNMIEHRSETMIHFYPSDKRRLYRANKAVGRMAARGVDWDKLICDVNEGIDDKHHARKDEIVDLMAASSPLSLNPKPIQLEEEEGGREDRFMADSRPGPDRQAEENEAWEKVVAAGDGLSIWEKKFLRLKGVELSL